MAISIPTRAYFHYQDEQLLILNGIYDSPITNADPVKVFKAHEIAMSIRAGFVT
jgi:hypothetical protein